MDKKAQQRNKDAQQRRELMNAMELRAQIVALRHVRDRSDSTPEQILRAVELLMELEKN